MRNILGSVGIGVEPHHAQRITVLPRDQIGDGGFIVGAVRLVSAKEVPNLPERLMTM